MIMKKIISTLLSLVLVIGILPIMASADEVTPAWDGTAAESFAGGAGTKSDPWQIETAAQLKLASDTVNGSHKERYFILNNDIDYENNQWAPIGYSTTNNSIFFTGGFDGNQHVIRNVKLDYSYDDFATVTGKPVYVYCGFFGFAKDVTITDLGIENFHMTISNPGGTGSGNYRAKYIGGFVGALRGAVNVSGCYIKNVSVRQVSRWNNESCLGGFVGFIQSESNKTVSITNCYAYNLSYCASVRKAVGGFVGVLNNDGGDLTNCYIANVTEAISSDSASTVFGFGHTGSDSRKPGTITNCYSTITSAVGKDSQPATYSTARDFGVSGASLSTIDNIFTKLANWQDGKYINNGFPALAWEKAPIEVKDFAEGTVTIEINKATDDAMVYVATYDGSGRLVSADVEPIAETITANVTTAGATYVKVFVWDADLNPVAITFSKTL